MHAGRPSDTRQIMSVSLQDVARDSHASVCCEQAVVVNSVGDTSAMTYAEDQPVPLVGVNQVLVKNQFAGLNFIDTYHRSGLYKRDLPFILGGDGGGEIAAIGSGVTGWNVGDKVAYMADGSYAEYTAVPVGKLVKVPEQVDMKLAIAAMVQGLTAHYLVTSAHCGLIQEGEWCLIYSVGSGTGQWAAQMAKLRGYKVIGTCSAAKAEMGKTVGCDELILLDSPEGKSYADYASTDLAAKVMEITNNVGCKCVVDGIGKSTWEISLKVLARRGIWISFGNASGVVPDFSPLKLAVKSAFLTRPKLGDYVASREELDGRWSEVVDWIATGKLAMSIDRIFPLAEAAEGHKYIESGQTKGKILFQL
jgi:NADPH:quinone reductase